MSRAAAFDGHLHTTFSDGALSPEALVDLAHASGVRALALTDHDTFAGHARAAARCQERGIEFVPGVEMSLDLDGREVHVLAYFASAAAEPLARALDAALAERRAHLPRILARLAEHGMVLGEDEVLAEARRGGAEAWSIGRPHIARAMLARGWVATFDEAFERWLGTHKPGWVKRNTPAAADLIGLAVAHGAVCSVAHPGVYDLGTAELDRLRIAGIAAIEVYHPDHSQEQVLYYLRHCERLSLLPTGGSDFHAPHVEGARPGSYGLDAAAFARLKARRRPGVA